MAVVVPGDEVVAGGFPLVLLAPFGLLFALSGGG